MLERQGRHPRKHSVPFARALPIETKVEGGTFQSKSGTSDNLSNSGDFKGQDLEEDAGEAWADAALEPLSINGPFRRDW